MWYLIRDPDSLMMQLRLPMVTIQLSIKHIASYNLEHVWLSCS